MSAKTATTNERGEEYQSAPTGESIRCATCDTKVPVRNKGRRPRFCSPACRITAHRWVQQLATAQEGVTLAHQRLREAEERIRHLERFRASATGDPDQMTIEEAMSE